MKCPLRKTTTLGVVKNEENFRDCIENECAAYNPRQKVCNYFSGLRHTVEVK